MRKYLVLAAIAVPVLFILAALFIIFNRGLPDEAQTELTRYLAQRYTSSPASMVRRTTHATRPWLLQAAQSGPTYSTRTNFQTTERYNAASTERPQLPYPPEEAWCVQLGANGDEAEVVLVALHMDLYRSEWVVHEMPPAWSSGQRRALAADLGCDLETR